jgi:hypothetical protein
MFEVYGFKGTASHVSCRIVSRASANDEQTARAIAKHYRTSGLYPQVWNNEIYEMVALNEA